MDRVLFGDNQFFGISHLSEERARAQSIRFRNLGSIIRVLEYAQGIGLNTFMCTTHDRIWQVCDFIRENKASFGDYKIYPCMPYAHKYANAITELGYIGTLKQYMPGNLISSMTTSGIAFVKRDYAKMMRLLVDAEMKMFDQIETPVIFLQNVVTDLLLGLGMGEYFPEFGEYVKERYGAEPGFITMNMPMLVDELDRQGMDNPIVCASINKIGYRMSGGIEVNERTLKEKRFRAIAMQVLAAGAIPPAEALEYVSTLEGVESILFGASSPAHINQTKELVEQFSR